jgi:hypothetical protein
MNAEDLSLLREIGLGDVRLLLCSPKERRSIRRLVECGLVELTGGFFKRARITARGLGFFD